MGTGLLGISRLDSDAVHRSIRTLIKQSKKVAVDLPWRYSKVWPGLEGQALSMRLACVTIVFDGQALEVLDQTRRRHDEGSEDE